MTATTVVWLEEGAAGRFVDIDDCDRLPLIREDSDLQGAIELEVNGVDLLNRVLVDDIITMWVYIASMVNDYMNGLKAMAPLPEQSILVSLKPLPRGQALMSVEGNSWRRASAADAEELLFTLRFAGNEFFDKVEALTGRFWPQARTFLNAGSEFQ
ncbi:hypothetical protein [Amycolatopsis keratiniphila]|uniref:hypothetical protein n=1 Tax=Amycolatopsis keratiniphila TaxID=129921 RepID=UPI000F4D8335|nr:hypothetical protein [Amycolatopsis keratiniphila]